MPKYTMPDGNAYDFQNDEEATRAMKAWDKQFGGKEEPSYARRVLDAGDAILSTGARMIGMAPQGLGLLSGAAQSLVTGGPMPTMENTAHLNPMTKIDQMLPPSENTKASQEIINEGMDKLGQAGGRLARMPFEMTGLAGVGEEDARTVGSSITDPKKKAEFEKALAAQETVGEFAGNFIPLGGRINNKPFFKRDGKSSVRSKLLEEQNRSKDVIDTSKAWEEINALDAQLGKGTSTAYGKSGQGKWMLDENGMPVRETLIPPEVPGEVPAGPHVRLNPGETNGGIPRRMGVSETPEQIAFWKSRADQMAEQARNNPIPAEGGIGGTDPFFVERAKRLQQEAIAQAEAERIRNSQTPIPLREGEQAQGPYSQLAPKINEPVPPELPEQPRRTPFPEITDPNEVAVSLQKAGPEPVPLVQGGIGRTFDGINQPPVRGDGRLSNLPNLDTGFGFEPKRPAPTNFAGQVEAARAAREERAGTIDFPGRVEHLTSDPMVQQMLRELDQRKSEIPRMEAEKAKGGQRAAEVAEAQRQTVARIEELEAQLRDNGWTGEPMSGNKGMFGFGKGTLAPIEKSGTRDTRVTNDVGKPFDPKRNSLGKFKKKGEYFPTADGSGIVKLGNGAHFFYNPEVFKRDFRHIVDFAKKGLRVIAQGVENGLQVKAFDRDGNPIGGSLFVPKNDFGGPQSTPLESRMTGVDKDFRGRGVAAAMYQVAADLGNSVVPSKSRTAEGRKMWEGFESRGISKNNVILPNRMRGSVEGMGNSTLLKAWDRLTSKKAEDPVTQHSSNVDLAAAGSKLPGVGKAFNGIDIPPAEPKSFLEYAKDWISDKDSDLSWGEKVRGTTVTAGANLLAKATKNPLVAAVFHQVDNANRVSEAMIKQHVQPLSSAARHMSKQEFSDIVYALQLKEGKGEWTKQQLLNSGMSEKQANWIQDFYRVDKLALDATNVDRVARGLKPITARTAHMASTFLGDYRTLIKNKDGDIKYVISHNNKWMQKKALEAIEAKFPRKDFVYEELPFQRKNQRFDRDADAGFRILMDTLAKDDPVSTAIRDAYVAWKDKTAGHYLGQSQHAKAKSVDAVGGAEGLKLEKSFEQNAADSIQAQMRFFENSFQAAEMGKATHNLYQILEDAKLRENKPNSVAYALDYIENARGWRTNLIGDMAHAIETASGKAGLGTNLPSQTSAILRSVLNAKLLGGWNPAFWYVNLVQMVNALPEMASVAGRIGNPSWAMAKFSEGSMKMLTNSLHKDPFWKEASDWARDHGISKSAIDIDTADIGKWKGMHTIDTVWNGPRRVIEEQTRRMVFGAFLEVLKDHYPKQEAFRMAASGVERSLGDYRPFEKAMAFESGGFIGKNAGFLRTYTMNAFSQLGASLKSAEYANFLKLFGLLTFSSGVAGMIGVQQADWMINQYNEWFASKTGVRIPSVKEFLLKNGSKYFGKYADAVTFGPHSTLYDYAMPGSGGIDLSGRMGFQNVAPESVMDLVMPGSGDLGKLAVAGAKTVLNPTSKDSWMQLAHTAAPASMKFLAESAMERPDTQGNLKLVSPSSGQLTNYSRTDVDRDVRKLNARSVNESKALSKDFAHVSEERQLSKLRNDVMDKFGKSYASAKTNFEINKLAKEAADRYLELGGSPDGVVSALEAAIEKYKLTPVQRENLKANPMVIKRRQEYGN